MHVGVVFSFPQNSGNESELIVISAHAVAGVRPLLFWLICWGRLVELFGDGPALVHRLSRDCRAIVGKLSGDCLGIVWAVSADCLAIV